MKRSLSTFVLVIFAVAAISPGCQDTDRIEGPARMKPQPGPSVTESAEFQRLLEIANEMVLRAARGGLTGRELEEACAGTETERFIARLGYSPDEFRDLGAELERLSRVLYERYPALMDEAGRNESECASCDASLFAERWDRCRAARVALPSGGDSNQIPAPDPSKKGVRCRWARYSAALIACAASGNPVFYFACAFIALCSYCSGGWVSALCGH